jgi:catalase
MNYSVARTNVAPFVLPLVAAVVLASCSTNRTDTPAAEAAPPPLTQSPTKFEQFTASHPSVPAALATMSTPDSFADEEYYGLDAFVFVNKAGERQAVRYQMMPERVVHLATA